MYTKTMRAEVVVIGGGAAGALAAAIAAERGHSVILLEPNRDIGRKLRLTGKGRCNLTNLCDTREFLKNVPRNGKFLYSALSALTAADTMEMFENMGLALKVERGRRVFPVSDKAGDVADALSKRLEIAGVRIERAKAKKILTKDDAVCGVLADSGRIETKSIILATGGASYPATGSRGDGYRMARELGHCVNDIKPSLVPLTDNDGGCAALMGLSLKNIKLTVQEDNKTVFEDQGELLFTHFGVSGPLVLSASAHMRRFGEASYRLLIDLKPALSEKTLDSRILTDFEKRRNSDLVNALPDLLPRLIIPAVIERSGIDPRIKVHSITREQRYAILHAIKSFAVPIRGTRPVEEAVISSGGVEIREIDPRTMRSKLIGGLFFAGELIDVDAYTGGYNLQIAWSTGFVAGNSV